MSTLSQTDVRAGAPIAIAAIFISPQAGAPMQSVEQIEVAADVGLEGDRYALGIGAYSRIEPVKVRHATFISLHGIEEANALLAGQGLSPFMPVATRRNFLLDGITAEGLNALTGRRFSVAGVEFEGLELATPCPRPSWLLKRGDIFKRVFEDRGGLRAQVLGSGQVRIGDVLVVP